MESIIPIPIGIEHMKSGSDTLNFMLHYPKTYVMDNHLGAGWCWLHELNPKQQYNFFHIDQHEDLGAALDPKYYQHLKNDPKVPIDEYVSLSYRESFYQGKVFIWDNYIKQIQRLFPDWFSNCYFACPSDVYDPSHSPALSLNIVYNANPLELYNNIDYLIKKERRRFIVNLDIDYFFDDKCMPLYSEEYIRAFAQHLNDAMENIAVLTIALSPECCGGWEQAFRVYEIVAKELDVIDSYDAIGI